MFRTKVFGPAVFVAALVSAGVLALALRPLGGTPTIEPQLFTVQPGEGFRGIADRLREENLIRSPFAFKILGFLTGGALRIQPGVYRFSRASSSARILSGLVHGTSREVEVRIPEGATVYEIDALLSGNGIITPGALRAFADASRADLEGKLFPDTYRFFIQSDAETVVQKFLENFEAKAASLLAYDPNNGTTTLIIASLLEREVPGLEERRIVAGIIIKRLTAGIPLQVDATICYAKQVLVKRGAECLPISALDLKLDSPYNTYVHKGLPPTPIGNPGLLAIRAALDPEPSPYWYYLSDPRTKLTIFAKTFEEHVINKTRYLGQ